MERFYPIIIAAVLLCCFLIYKEWKRENSARLLLRMVAVILLIASLVFLIVPITKMSAKTSNLKQLLLLTPGFANKIQKNETYFTLDSSVLRELGGRGVKYLPELGYYLRTHPEVRGVTVFGYGLASDELTNVGELSYNFEAAPDPGGIASVSWPNVMPATTALNVQGTYENKADVPVQLRLQGAGSPADSLTIAANQKANFSLSCWPKQSGKAIYHLTVHQGHKQISSENIPVKIVEPPKLKVMVLAASPDFEFKFLRNWLFENQYPAYFRTRISKDKFSIDALNLTARQPETFSTGMFKDFDVVIADDEELAALSAAQSASLNNEVLNGLGLIVRINERKPVSTFGKAFRINAATDSMTTSIVPVLVGASKKLKAIPVNQPVFVDADPAKRSLIENPKGSILLSSRLYGRGTVAASTIISTYNWLLTGASADYASYWSHVINKTARKAEEKLSWQVKPQFPVVNERVSIAFQISTGSVVPAFSLNKESTSTLQHQLLPFYWQSSAWLDHTGWNEFKVSDQAAQNFFVYKPEEWSSVKIHKRLAENLQLARTSKRNNAINANRITYMQEPVSKWWFFGLFLISISFLWLEAKLLQ